MLGITTLERTFPKAKCWAINLYEHVNKWLCSACAIFSNEEAMWWKMWRSAERLAFVDLRAFPALIYFECGYTEPRHPLTRLGILLDCFANQDSDSSQPRMRQIVTNRERYLLLGGNA
jgi:hypothetical protein